MTSFRIRPRFQVETTHTIDEIQTRISQKLKEETTTCVGNIIHGHIVLRIPPDEQHYWSPQLSLTLETSDTGTLIRGLYGPSPNVWTLFTFSYATIGMLLMFISIIGFSQKNLGQTAPILWTLPVLLGIGIILYVMSQMGQKVGAEQTFTLHHFLEEAIDQRVHIH